MFGGGSSYTVHAVFENAGQLVPGNEVRVGGQPIGSITDIDADNDANAVVTMKVDDNFAPLHDGTHGDDPRHLPVGHRQPLRLAQARAQQRAEDRRRRPDRRRRHQRAGRPRRLFNTLDPKTRGGLRNFIRGSGDWYDGKAQQARESTKYFAPWLSSSSDLTGELALTRRCSRASSGTAPRR